MKYLQKNLGVKLAQLFSIAGLCLGASTLAADSYIVTMPGLVIDASSNKVAVWEVDNQTTSTGSIQSSTYDSGTSTWSTAVTISDTQDAFAPIVATNASGNTVAAWAFIDHVNGIYSLSVSMLDPMTGWSTPVVLNPTTEQINVNYQLKINASGQVAIIWNSSNTTTSVTSIWTSTAAFGGSWSTPVQLF